MANMLLDPNKILIPDYQMTTINRKQIDKIINEGWREEAGGELLVSHRAEDGRDYVYAGRHRLLAIRELIRLGRLPRHFLVKCDVYNMSLQHEMYTFRTAVERARTSREKWETDELTGEPVTVAVSGMASHFGFYHVRDTRSQGVPAPFRYDCEQTLLKIHSGERLQNTSYKGLLSPTDGPAVLAVVLYLHKICWLPRASQTRGNILRKPTVDALAEIVHRYGSSHSLPKWPFANQAGGSVDMSDLEVVLQQHTPDQWVEVAERIAGRKDSTYLLLSRLMLFGKDAYERAKEPKLWYNRNRRGATRLPMF